MAVAVSSVVAFGSATSDERTFSPTVRAFWWSSSRPPSMQDYTHYKWGEMEKVTKQREKDLVRLNEYMVSVKQRLWTCNQLPSRETVQQCVDDLRSEVARESAKITYGDSSVTVERRQKYVQKYGCTAWTEEALETLKEHTPLIELGAGQGLWAKELKKQYGDDVSIAAFDNHGSPQPYLSEARNVEFGDESALQRKEFAESTLFLCYPPLTQDSPLGINSLKLYRGKTLIYVGEGRRGSNCSEEFFDMLESQFRIVKVVDLNPFPGGAEKMFVLERKEKVEEGKEDVAVQ